MEHVLAHNQYEANKQQSDRHLPDCSILVGYNVFVNKVKPAPQHQYDAVDDVQDGNHKQPPAHTFEDVNPGGNAAAVVSMMAKKSISSLSGLVFYLVVNT